MILKTRRDRAKVVADEWKDNWTLGGGSWFGGHSEEVYRRLVALGPEPHPDDVDEAIGSGGWTTFRCDECGRKVTAVIELGLTLDPGDASELAAEAGLSVGTLARLGRNDVCVDCLRRALGLLGRVEEVCGD